MKRPLRPEETRLWAVVAATVRPAHGRGGVREVSSPIKPAPLTLAPEPPKKAPPAKRVKKPKIAAPTPVSAPLIPKPAFEPDRIEPNRHRRLVRERDPLDRRLDLHGLTQDKARDVLIAFLLRAQAEGVRAVLVITGKGSLGEGVLRKRAPDWLAEPMLREVVAGVSQADRRHGGEGALYVALKRRRG